MTLNKNPKTDYLMWWLILVSLISVASLVTEVFFNFGLDFGASFELFLWIVLGTVGMWGGFRYKKGGNRQTIFFFSLIPLILAGSLMLGFIRTIIQP
jgi:hypothetical protein